MRLDDFRPPDRLMTSIEAGLLNHSRQCAFAVHIELSKDRLRVVADGRRRERKQLRDLFVSPAFGDFFGYLTLARGQKVIETSRPQRYAEQGLVRPLSEYSLIHVEVEFRQSPRE